MAGTTVDRPDIERARREARVAGLRDFRTPSLESIERRRMQLLALNAIVLLTVVAGVFALSTWPVGSVAALRNPIPRFGLLLATAGFCWYVFDQERRLGRLTKMLADERVLTAALTNRLHEVSLLLDAGKQMNAHLQMDELLDTILRSACELLDATGGSVMLVEETCLITVCALGRDAAVGQRMRLGEGVGGYVAIRREPVLIDGHVDPELFPGLVLREPYVESAMSVPLVHRAELQGVLNVNAPIGRSFTEYDLRALAVFAEQAALAVANARLYEAERAHVAALLDLRTRREVG